MPHILVSTETNKVVGCSINLWGTVVRKCVSCPESCEMQDAAVVWSVPKDRDNGKAKT